MSNTKFDTSLDKSLENELKDFLEEILSFLERFIESQEEVAIVENKLHDYDNLSDLTKIMRSIFGFLKEKTMNKLCLTVDIPFDTDYQKLEKIVQKHEKEIREHIGMEQQLRICAEAFQSKLEEVEKERDLYKKENHNLSKINKELNLKMQVLELENNKFAKIFRNHNLSKENIQSQTHRFDELSNINKECNDSPKILQKSMSQKWGIKDSGISNNYIKSRLEKKFKKDGNTNNFDELTTIYGNSMKGLIEKNKKEIIKETCPQFYKMPNHSVNINVTNLTNSLIVANPNNSINLPKKFKINNHKRSKSHGFLKKDLNFDKTGILKKFELFVNSKKNFH